jgi:cellulose synthase/poly-beta-1,6-N-acetylglucosamine synthase-like glycosyltransferase
VKNIASNNIKIAIIIFAHDESSVIEKTVLSAKKTLESGDALFVISDNSRDDTAIKAEKTGACVFIRDNGSRIGKGEALAWFVKYHWDILRKFSRLVILDADSYIEPGFLKAIKANLSDANLVLQCFVIPVEYNSSPISTLIALSELVEQSVFDRIRTKLGWPIRLRGTGMVISPDALLSVSDQIQTEVEDIALTVLFTENKIKIKQLAGVEVFDPKPVETSAASRQRARWFRGQWAALWCYRSKVFRILCFGPAGLSLVGSLFLKPRWLVMAMKVILACLFYELPVLAAFVWFLVLIDIILYLTGIFLLKEKKVFLKAIIYIPGFVLMWMKSIFLSFQRLSWLRVRESAESNGLSGYVHPELIKTVKVN